MEESLPIFPDLSFKGGYYTVYREVKNYIEDWRGNEKPSPFFYNKKVKITKSFFKHIVGKSYQGQHMDVLNRLRQLPNVRQILEGSKEVFGEVKRINDWNFYSLIGQVYGGRIIKVIVSRERISDEPKLHSFYLINTALQRYAALSSQELVRVQALFNQPILRIRAPEMERVTGRVLDIDRTAVTHNFIMDLGNKLAWVSIPLQRELNIGPGVVIELKPIIGQAKGVDLKIKR